MFFVASPFARHPLPRILFSIDLLCPATQQWSLLHAYDPTPYMSKLSSLLYRWAYPSRYLFLFIPLHSYFFDPNRPLVAHMTSVEFWFLMRQRKCWALDYSIISRRGIFVECSLSKRRPNVPNTLLPIHSPTSQICFCNSSSCFSSWPFIFPLFDSPFTRMR